MEKITSRNPHKEVIDTVAKYGMEFGIGHQKLGTFLEDLADALRAIPENNRALILYEYLDPRLPECRELHKKIEESCQRNQISPPNLLMFLSKFNDVIFALPDGLQPEALQPDFLKGVGGTLKSRR